jgi:FdhD protein
VQRAAHVAVEQPLEIRLARAGEPKPGRGLSVTMRTPGHDAELAVGFLVGEGLIRERRDVIDVAPCGGSGNVIRVELRPDLAIDTARLERNFYTTSSCGVCGKSSIEAVMGAVAVRRVASGQVIDPAILPRLPAELRAAQSVFEATGGLHAAGLFDLDGRLLEIREDVGRHNAMDKLVGARFLAGRLPLADCLVLLSGRASFELLQKALAAGVPIVAAIGAPSSLAIELAEAAGITLVAFLRDGAFNTYSCPERLRSRPAADVRVAGAAR